MKKIIVGIFSLALLLVGTNSALASGWNQYPGDCPAINIGNDTTGQGINYPCWNGTNVTATAGQVIKVKVFYDNTNGVAANNTIISLNQSPSGSTSSTNFTFSGNLTSSAGNLPLSQVTANISSSQTLIFSQATWFKNGASGTVPLPNGQTGAEVLTGGLSLGTIPDGDWGNINFAFTVGNNGGGGGSNCTISSNLQANPTSINQGGSSTLTWNTNGCSSVIVSGPNFNSSSSNGPATVTPNNLGNNTYTLTATGSNGQTQTQTATVYVNNNNQNNCVINYIYVNGQNSVTVSQGNSATLSWSTSNCTSVYVSGLGFSSSNPTGNQTVYPQYQGSYTITASGSNGSVPQQSAYVNMNNNGGNNCYIDYFSVNNAQNITIPANTSVNLIWSTHGCTNVSVSGPNFYDTGITGNRYFTPNGGTYTITAYGSNGNYVPSQYVYINVGSQNNLYCTISSFYASPNSVTASQPVTLSWTTNNCTSVNISGVGSNLPVSYSQVVYPSSTTTYNMNAYGSNGNPSQSVTVGVTSGPIYVNNTCAVTTVATNVGQNSATLNGLISSGSGSSYFEYGRTVNLGSQTTPRFASGNFNEVISGLSSNTSYFYRLVSNCGNGGLSYGKIDVFQTQGTTVINNTRPIIVQGTTVVGTASPIMLKIEDRYDTISIGDLVDYTVTYKNIGKTVLTNPIVQVIIPRGITLVQSSAGTYATDTNTLTVPIQDLRPGEDGVIYLQGHVDSLSSYSSQVVTTAILVYTNPSGAQENAIAYVLNNPREIIVNTNNNLGAAAFFLGIFPTTLLGWLLLLLLILIIILLTRRYYRKSTVHVTGPNGSSTTTTHY